GLLGAAARAAVVRRRRRREGERPAGRGPSNDGRVRRVVLEGPLEPPLQCVRRQSPRCDALASLRHIRDGSALARRDRAARGRARVGLHHHARLRARVSRRALRRRPPRGGRLDGRRAPRVPARGAARGTRFSRRREAGGARARGALMVGAKGGNPHGHDSVAVREEMPRVLFTRRSALAFAAFVLASIALLYVVLPQIGGVRHTWNRLNSGDSWWIAVAVVF